MGYSLHNIISPYKAGTYSDKPATINVEWDLTQLSTNLEKLPYVDKAIMLYGSSFPGHFYSIYDVTKVSSEGESDKKDETQPNIYHDFADSRLFEIVSMKLLEGRIYRPDETQAVVINESAKDLLKQYNKKGNLLDGYQIVGVVADCYDSPFSTPVPIMYRNINHKDCKSSELNILLKIKDGAMNTKHKKNDIRNGIEEVYSKIDPSAFVQYSDLEENFEKGYLTSVKNLRNLFLIVSIICMLISIFGIYSLASLTCEQRRKEIAIRKINGATMTDILNLFFKEFFILLGIAIVIAFPIGYYAMNLWLEQYTRRVPMGLPLFLGVALSLALIIVASIFLRVWRAASSNPAEVVKENN